MVAKYKRILKKLQAFKKFQEITKAIRFVAGGELGRLRGEINKRFTALSSVVPLHTRKYFSNDFNKCLVVPITDDRGSCGSHNNNVINKANVLVSRLEKRNKTLLIYSLGKKSKLFFGKFYKTYFVGYGANVRDVKFTIENCDFITEKLYQFNFDRLYLVFNRYFSIQVQRALSYQFSDFGEYALTIIDRANSNEKGSIFFNSLKNRGFVNDFLYDLYFHSMSIFLLDALEDNIYSFLAGRFNAMDNAIRNSTDMIERLTILYNKARQEYITTELIEIVSCKEAILNTSAKTTKRMFNNNNISSSAAINFI
jgi:F-type H+-transporting ATPase subunit gamma